jgi:queuine/archaeosine tRNA-ribosyltransferase
MDGRRRPASPTKSLALDPSLSADLIMLLYSIAQLTSVTSKQRRASMELTQRWTLNAALRRKIYCCAVHASSRWMRYRNED